MNKQLIICEGKDDSLFLEVLLEKEFPTYKYDPFDLNSGNLENTRNKQSKELSKFKISDNKNNILIKSEGGVDKVKSIVTSSFMDIILFKPIIVLDSDSKEPKGYIEKEFKRKLEKRFKENFIFSIEEDKGLGEVLRYDLRYVHKKSNGKRIHFVFFKPNLDKVIGIQKEKDLEKDKKNKIKDYISYGKIKLIFSKILV